MRIQLVILFIAMAFLLVFASALNQMSNVITSPVVFRQDFEEGHISGWESYPPFQDSAFDPEFKCTGENNRAGSRYALARKVQIGFTTNYEIGFIRKVHLLVTKSSDVSFSYLLKMLGDAKKLEVVACGMDGKKYVRTIASPKNDRWQTVTIPASSLKSGRESLSPGAEIEAFYVLAYIDKTNPDVAYRFYLDNVVITGAAPVQFRILEPTSTVLEHWNKTVLHKHYAAGEKLDLRISVPSPVTLTSVTFSLWNPRGTNVIDGMALSFRQDRNVWEHPAHYTFSGVDERGRWRATLRGEDSRGRYLETSFDVWVADKSQPHPRLYFGADNTDTYKRRLEDPKWKIWFDTLSAKSARLRTTSNLGSLVFGSETSSLRNIPPTQWTLESMAQVDLSVYDTTYVLPTINHYFSIMVPAMNILYDHALLYELRRDREAGEYAKNALVAIANWKTWTHQWFRARHQESYYPVGELGVRAALCYDVVYPLLSAEERKSVQDGLLRNCIIPIYQEYVVENRIPSSTSNWVGNSVSGALSSILALYGDNPALGDFEPYFSGLLTKLENHIQSTLDTSGAWGEGVSYQGFAYTNALPTLTALQRVLRTDVTSPGLLRSYLYMFYNYSHPKILDVGDSGPSLNTLSYFGWISSRANDPVFRWFYAKAPREHELDFLFGSEVGPSMAPDSLPTSKHFSGIGGVVFRSGWSSEDLVMNFRSGPFYNHQHFDQGGFQLRAFGETLVPEAGGAHYYNDPWYSLYYIHPVGHNTILLDENPGSQRSGDYLHFVRATNERAEMREFIGTPFYAAATGEVHKLYRGKLALFERNLLFMSPEYFVIFDRLRSSGREHEYNWLLHFDDRKDVRIAGNDILVEREKASLLAKVLAPNNAVIKIKGAPVRLGVPITHPGYLQVSNFTKSKSEHFLVVLYPKKADAAITELSNKISSVKGKNYVGVRVKRDDAEDEMLFRIDEDKEKIRNSRLSTDGRIAAMTTRGNQIERLAVHDATYLTYNTVRQLAGTISFTAAGSFDHKITEWEVHANDAGTITLYSPGRPLDVKYNGQSVSRFSLDEKNHLLTIAVSKGTNRIAIHY